MLTVTPSLPGNTATLVNADGDVLASGGSAIDLSTVPAGDYFLRVDGDASPFDVRFTTPAIGRVEPVFDRDLIHGDDEVATRP